MCTHIAQQPSWRGHLLLLHFISLLSWRGSLLSFPFAIILWTWERGTTTTRWIAKDSNILAKILLVTRFFELEYEFGCTFGNLQKAAGSVGVLGKTLQMPWRPQRQSVAADANARGSLQPRWTQQACRLQIPRRPRSRHLFRSWGWEASQGSSSEAEVRVADQERGGVGACMAEQWDGRNAYEDGASLSSRFFFP